MGVGLSNNHMHANTGDDNEFMMLPCTKKTDGFFRFGYAAVAEQPFSTQMTMPGVRSHTGAGRLPQWGVCGVDGLEQVVAGIGKSGMAA